jgi:hypothetical protein
MNTTAVEAAERFGQRPGYDLTNFREVGLPIYRQTVIAIVMEEKPLPALQEFALRSIEAGFVTPSAITAFLGLDEGDLNEALYGLISDGFVRVLNTGTTGEELGITERGRAVMEEFRMVPPRKRHTTSTSTASCGARFHCVTSHSSRVGSASSAPSRSPPLLHENQPWRSLT